MPYPTHLLPTTVVGSYPQPDWLVDRAGLHAHGVPRTHAHDIWRIPEPLLEQAQDDATVLAMRDMERAGIDDGVTRKKDGKLGRNVSRLSFHSLRHSFNSAMANADVPLEIRQKLTGHASQDMNKHYTHLELETVRRAVESISRLPGKAF